MAAGRDPTEHVSRDEQPLEQRLAGASAAQLGASVAERYAALGARWLADPVPTRLDAALVARLERLGFQRASLAEVRVHRGPRAQDAAAALGARAFAVGERDVFFGAGEFDPHSRSGQAVLAHELAHVAPPSLPGGAASASGAPPLLQTRKRGHEDAAGAEAHERAARETERRVLALEDSAPPPAQHSAPAAQRSVAAAATPAAVDPAVLEAKVMQLLERWERTEAERLGRSGR